MRLEHDSSIVQWIRKSISSDSILGADDFIDNLKERFVLTKSSPRGSPRIR